jgi:hypothetical protein
MDGFNKRVGQPFGRDDYTHYAGNGGQHRCYLYGH